MHNEEFDDLPSDEEPNFDPALSSGGIKALASAIVGAVNDAHGPRKMSFDEYLRNVDTHRHKGQLTRKVFQNGILLQRDQLTADAIDMLNVLQPGIYCDGLFQVVATQDGSKMSALDIRYANKSVDERMQLKTQFPTFEHMLAAMLKERAAA